MIPLVALDSSHQTRLRLHEHAPLQDTDFCEKLALVLHQRFKNGAWSDLRLPSPLNRAIPNLTQDKFALFVDQRVKGLHAPSGV